MAAGEGLLFGAACRCLEVLSGCGLRTRPARGTRVFVITLLVKVTWTSCAGQGGKAVLGVKDWSVLLPSGGHLKILNWLIKEEYPYNKIYAVRLLRMESKRGRCPLEWLDE